MESVITRVGVNEAAILADLSRKTFYDTFSSTCPEKDMQSFLDEHYDVRKLEAELRDVNNHNYFALVSDIPAGYIRFQEDYSSLPVMSNWKALELKRIYVIQELQGKGVAQAMMKFILDFAEAQRYEVIWLGVWEHNLKAKSFYLKYGFTHSGHRHAFPIGDTQQTDDWLWKFLPKS